MVLHARTTANLLPDGQKMSKTTYLLFISILAAFRRDITNINAHARFTIVIHGRHLPSRDIIHRSRREMDELITISRLFNLFTPRGRLGDLFTLS